MNGNGDGLAAKQLATNFVVYDQFGDEMTGLTTAMCGGNTATATGTTEFTGVIGDSKNQKVVVGIGTDNKIYAECTDDGGATVDDVYKYKIEDGWFLTMKCTKAGFKAAAEYEVSITN